MRKTVGELLTSTLADHGVTQIFGIVGDALNPFTYAIRRDKRISWLGIDYLQAADHVQSFRDACVYAQSINSPDAASAQIHEAISAAYGSRGVALLNVPQDVFGAKTSNPPLSPQTLRQRPEFAPAESDIDAAARLIDRARLPVTLGIVGSSRPSALALLNRAKTKDDDAFLRSSQKNWTSWVSMLDEKSDPARSVDRIHPQALARSVSDLAADDAVAGVWCIWRWRRRLFQYLVRARGFAIPILQCSPRPAEDGGSASPNPTSCVTWSRKRWPLPAPSSWTLP